MQYTHLIETALEEDSNDPHGHILPGDHSSLSIFGTGKSGNAKLLVKDNGILAGVALAIDIFNHVDPSLVLTVFKQDGDIIQKGDIVLTAHGNICSLLRAERVVLNFMQRMSGIATVAAQYTNAVKHTSCKIVDTRKTTPGLRYIEKWAVRIGGAHNHRFGLYDMIMLKDNHVDFAGGVRKAIQMANIYKNEHNLSIPIEIETRSLSEVKEAVDEGNIQRIMLDNFTVNDVREAVSYINGRFETEASGGITLETVVQYAETGVSYISVGALTHSVRSLDLSFKAVSSNS